MLNCSSNCSTSWKCFEIGWIIQNGIRFYIFKDVYKWLALKFEKKIQFTLLHHLNLDENLYFVKSIKSKNYLYCLDLIKIINLVFYSKVLKLNFSFQRKFLFGSIFVFKSDFSSFISSKP